MQCRVYFPGWFHFTVPFFQIEVDSGAVRVHLDLNTRWLGRMNLLSEYIFEIYFSKNILLERGGLWVFIWSGNVLVMCRGEMGLYFSSVIISGVQFCQCISEICLLNCIFFLNHEGRCLGA